MAEVQLTIDDIKGVVGSMVIDSIIKDKRIAELTAEVERLKGELNVVNNNLPHVDGPRNRDGVLPHADLRAVAGN